MDKKRKRDLLLAAGILLLAAIMLFDVIGENLKRLLNPGSGHE